jgi:hypothetical protein
MPKADNLSQCLLFNKWHDTVPYIPPSIYSISYAIYCNLYYLDRQKGQNDLLIAQPYFKGF